MKYLALITALAAPSFAFANPDPADWGAVTTEANGQTVYWNAWGGSTTTNDFIAWVGSRVMEDYGVTLEHVKLTDTADAVTRVLAEKQAGEDDDGAIDMIWINGSNFAAMKDADLLFGPFAEQLPNWAVVDVAGKTVQTDFTVPVNG
ncbi:MAG: ABC transporter substrate-binding protein, partial [Octadecabacter sp.]